MPWRETQDPYSILVSEVMLQQTQVARVLIKYPLFIHQFPHWERLASASTKDALSAWVGMGYNRRALYLKRTAETVVKKFNGVLPEDLETLDTLPGIGAATAASITAFAFNKPVVFIETNIRRVFLHHFFKDETNIDDKDILPLVEDTLDRKNSREWYFALMDYGAHLAKTIENPNKRSKHYSTQSSFTGSDRQVRGKILRLLLKTQLSKEQILSALAIDSQKAITILNGLIKEKFVSIENNIYAIR
ncbi:endonuclease III [Candidatus Roizmanbacteria bacterium CG_4_10_14_0_8_um_filter_39_9]|uniref:Endonuclease III n=1 Tax=Candidatus Roizmanbacteria bacterium CG_4_10_14_0_8_um_filter_39_9 TaxID=1974829 RepID=A0A2M7QE16_9BACT|nr:MAG: endonuclease III [Candidatus Roizmanbacteria bacterium CG_4_10_14_0_8_um_filter_39_9]